jgi:hypothetical protein
MKSRAELAYRAKVRHVDEKSGTVLCRTQIELTQIPHLKRCIVCVRVGYEAPRIFYAMERIRKIASLLHRKGRIAIMKMQLEDRVLTALEGNPYLGRRNLRFETSDGRVTLRGVVDTYFQKQMAQEAIRHVDGVDEIANELEVCWA